MTVLFGTQIVNWQKKQAAARQEEYAPEEKALMERVDKYFDLKNVKRKLETTSDDLQIIISSVNWDKTPQIVLGLIDKTKPELYNRNYFRRAAFTLENANKAGKEFNIQFQKGMGDLMKGLTQLAKGKPKAK